MPDQIRDTCVALGPKCCSGTVSAAKRNVREALIQNVNQMVRQLFFTWRLKCCIVSLQFNLHFDNNSSTSAGNVPVKSSHDMTLCVRCSLVTHFSFPLVAGVHLEEVRGGFPFTLHKSQVHPNPNNQSKPPQP